MPVDDKSEQKKKPIVVAGNGPSLAKIDYRRLPADFDVFRCNQFYFEEKYYLGKKVTGVFIRPQVVKQQFFNLKNLRDRKEYDFQAFYSISTTPKWEYESGRYIEEDFPEIISCYPYIKKMTEFKKLDKFHWIYYGQTFTAVIWMLITALALGYKEIYLVGLDFYDGGGADYAFVTTDKKNLCKTFPAMADRKHIVSGHTQALDLAAICLAQNMPNVNLFALSDKSPLSKYVPLAPVINKYIIPIERKRDDAVRDFLPLPEMPCREEYVGRILTFCKRIGLEKEYLSIKGTVIGKIALFLFKTLKDILICLKAGLGILLKIWRMPILLMKNKRINK